MWCHSKSNKFHQLLTWQTACWSGWFCQSQNTPELRWVPCPLSAGWCIWAAVSPSWQMMPEGYPGLRDSNGISKLPLIQLILPYIPWLILSFFSTANNADLLCPRLSVDNADYAGCGGEYEATQVRIRIFQSYLFMLNIFSLRIFGWTGHRRRWCINTRRKIGEGWGLSAQG